MKLDEKDPEMRKKMLEILKRMHEEQEEDDQDIEELAHQGLDSDDDDEVHIRLCKLFSNRCIIDIPGSALDSRYPTCPSD